MIAQSNLKYKHIFVLGSIASKDILYDRPLEFPHGGAEEDEDKEGEKGGLLIERREAAALEANTNIVSLKKSLSPDRLFLFI